jgi:hypothetical protein
MQPEYQVETFCRNCVFAEYTKNKQTGCTLNRSETFNPNEIRKSQDGKESYVFNRFCTAFRPEEWKLVLDEDEKKDLISTVRAEIFPPIGIFIFLKTETSDSLEALKNRIQEIKNQTVGTLRYLVIINNKVEYNEEIHSILRESFNFEETEFHIVQTLLDQEDLLYIDDAFKHAKNGWIYVCESNKKIREDLFEAIDDNINVKLNRVVLLEPRDGIDGMLFQASIHKLLDGSNSLLDPSSSERVRVDFLSKVREIAKLSEHKTVFTREEFFNDAS